MAKRLSGIGIAYPGSPQAHPMVGRRMPNIECDGTRLYELLREGKFVVVTAADIGTDRPDTYVEWSIERLPTAAQLTAAVDHWSTVTSTAR